ncbi:unnamed protein product [Natator depressus]
MKRSICGGYTSCHAAGSKIRACHQKELLRSLNTGFHIIRAEYNFVFPSGMCIIAKLELRKHENK